jgi:hypothetical protein
MRFLWIAVAVLLVAAGSEAQTTTTDPLVGTWEGSLQLAGDNPYRTLTILLVDGNKAYGFYGYTGRKLDGVIINVNRSGNRPSISFVTGAKLWIVLALEDEKSLVGNIHLSKESAGFGLQDREMSLGKVK